MPTSAAPRHAHDTTRTSDDDKPIKVRPNYAATVGLLIGAIGLFIVAALLLCIDGASEDLDIRPSWIMLVLTAGGTTLIAAHQEWRSALRCARDAERFELLKQVVLDQRAIRAEVADQRKAMLAEAEVVTNLLRKVASLAGPRALGRVVVGSHLRPLGEDTEALPQVGLDAEVIAMGRRISSKIAATGSSSGSTPAG